MTLWRRLVLWLAREEIAEVQRAAISIHQNDELQKRLHYAMGEAAGAERAFQEVERHLAERMAGAADLVSAEDLARARKGTVH